MSSIRFTPDRAAHCASAPLGIYSAAIELPNNQAKWACRVRRERQAFFHLCLRPRLTVGRQWAFLALHTCQQYHVTGRRLTKTTPLQELLVLGMNACEAWIIISRVRCSVICRQRRRCGKLTPSFREPAETSADLRGPATRRSRVRKKVIAGCAVGQFGLSFSVLTTKTALATS